MSLLHTARRLATGLSAALLLSTGAFAEMAGTTPKTAPAAPPASQAPAGECRGADMLAELKEKAPDAYAKVMAESAKLTNTEAVLWQVSKAGLAPSYLLGTMHISDSRISKLPARAKDAIAQSQSVALEVAELSSDGMAAAMTKVPGLMLFTDGRTLKSLLSEADFKKAQETVEKIGLSGDVAAMLRPWLVSMLLALSDCERNKIADGALVLDQNVAEEAKKAGLTVQGLETVEEQLSAMASVPDDQQIEMLKVGLKYADRADDLLETTVQMYLNRRIGAAMPFQEALAAQQGTPASAFDGFKTSLLVNRNAKMANAALPLLDKGKAFIAVGALHLPGPTGLVQLLRDKGFTLTPIE